MPILVFSIFVIITVLLTIYNWNKCLKEGCPSDEISFLVMYRTVANLVVILFIITMVSQGIMGAKGLLFRGLL
jgi:hypothetical protein